MKTLYVEINSNNHILRGMKHISRNNEYVFLIIHGYFSSNKIGPHRLYVSLANVLCERYGAVYRFDLSGMGESDGAIEETTIRTHVEDVKNILDFILQKESAKLVVISHCMGCNLLLEVLKDKIYPFREIIFLSPYFTNEDILHRFFKEQGQLEDLYGKGFTYRNGLYTDKSFFLENTFYDNFINSINTSKSFINIIAAGNDQFIPREWNERLRLNGRTISFIYIEQTDHNFLTNRLELFNRICELIEDNHYTE